MNELKKSMRDKVTWMTVIVGTIIFIAFVIIVLPWISNYSAVSIGVSESPDMSLIYTSDDMYRIADLYGVEGRKTYIFLRWTFDVVWPLVYAFFLVTWTMKLSKIISNKKWVNNLYIVPLTAMCFDYLENIGTTIVMARYPMESSVIATMTPFMSLLKWGILSGSFVLMLLLILVGGFKKTRKRIEELN